MSVSTMEEKRLSTALQRVRLQISTVSHKECLVFDNAYPEALPTLLEAVGMGNETSSMHGESFLPVLEGDADQHRDRVITGYYQGIERCTRDLNWSYIQRLEDEPDELF